MSSTSRCFPSIVLLIIGWLASIAPQAVAQLEGSAPFSSAGTTAEDVAQFLTKLQRAVKTDDRTAVTALADFPLRAWTGKTSVSIRDRKQFLALYPAIFSPALKQTIATASVQTSWSNWQGVMFESGRFWLRPAADGKLHLTAINPPTP
jgi:hypothetical protein